MASTVPDRLHLPSFSPGASKPSVRGERDLADGVGLQAQVEDGIAQKEAAYLESTPNGNIITGFDSYLKGTTGAASQRRKAGTTEPNRVFSRSSISYRPSNGVSRPQGEALQARRKERRLSDECTGRRDAGLGGLHAVVSRAAVSVGVVSRERLGGADAVVGGRDQGLEQGQEEGIGGQRRRRADGEEADKFRGLS